MHPRLLSFALLGLTFGFGCKAPAPTDVPDGDPHPEVEPPADEPAAAELSDTRRLSLDMTVEQVVAVLGEPDEKTEREEEGATGDVLSFWRFDEHDVRIAMGSSGWDGPPKSMRIIIAKGSTFAAPHGFSIGSPRSEIEDFHGDDYDRDFTDETTFVAGSIYGGIVYDFDEDNQVVEIFIGPFAE